MNDDQQLRLEALNQATRVEETPDETVARAEAYRAFLAGTNEQKRTTAAAPPTEAGAAIAAAVKRAQDRHIPAPTPHEEPEA